MKRTSDTARPSRPESVALIWHLLPMLDSRNCESSETKLQASCNAAVRLRGLGGFEECEDLQGLGLL